MLRRMRPLFSVGLGARLGSGRQYMSWISLEDEVRALQFAIAQPNLSGPVNLTGPAPLPTPNSPPRLAAPSTALPR